MTRPRYLTCPILLAVLNLCVRQQLREFDDLVVHVLVFEDSVGAEPLVAAQCEANLGAALLMATARRCDQTIIAVYAIGLMVMFLMTHCFAYPTSVDAFDVASTAFEKLMTKWWRACSKAASVKYTNLLVQAWRTAFEISSNHVRVLSLSLVCSAGTEPQQGGQRSCLEWVYYTHPFIQCCAMEGIMEAPRRAPMGRHLMKSLRTAWKRMGQTVVYCSTSTIRIRIELNFPPNTPKSSILLEGPTSGRRRVDGLSLEAETIHYSAYIPLRCPQ